MATTLAEAIERLAQQALIEHVGVQGSRLRSFESHQPFAAADVLIRTYDRSEGISDPSDMSNVHAIESATGTRGTLTDALGVHADPTAGASATGVAIARG